MKLNVPWLINTLLLCAIAFVSTYWFLQWTLVRTPREPLTAVSTGDQIARTQPLDTRPAARLFGATPTGESTAQGNSGLRLEGVIAEGGEGKGVALISVNSETALAYRAGDSIGSRYTLAEVRRDRIIIRSAAGTEEVRLPERPAPVGIVPSP